MKVLIIGGAGFIGSNTALRLLDAGHQVVVVDSFDPQIHGWDLAKSPTAGPLFGHAQVLAMDGLHLGASEELWKGVEAVLYLASATGTGQSMYDIQGYTRNNVSVAAVLAEQLLKRKSEIRRVVVSGTRAVFGEGAGDCPAHGRVFPPARRLEIMQGGQFEPVCPHCSQALRHSPTVETDPPSPSSVYGITKLAQEQIILNVCAAAGIPAIGFRYQNVYGPGQSLKNPYTGILSIFSQLIRKQAQINVFEDGMATRDFVYIDDVVEFNTRALTQSYDGNSVLNLGSGVRQTILDVVRELSRGLQLEARYTVSGQFRVGDIRHASADTSKLIQSLGSHSFVSFETGIRRFVDWVSAQEKDDEAARKYDRSLQEMGRAGLFLGGKK